MSYENGLNNVGYKSSAVSLNRLYPNYSNNFYDEAQANNTYNTLQRDKNNVRAKIERAPNAYDEVQPEPRNSQQKRPQNRRPSGKSLKRGRRDRWIRIAMMCLIVFVASVALILAIMLMMGKVGPTCSCESTGSSQNPEKLTSEEPQNESPKPATTNTFQLNLSPLQDVVEDLEKNLTALKAEAMAMLRELEENAASLLAAKKEFNSSEDAITLFLDRVLANLTQINENVEQQFDPDQGAVFADLRALNESKTMQLVELQQTSEQENDVINRRMETMNDTITDKVAMKISQPGPVGERGLNGSRGLVGDPGMVGSKGPKGAKGVAGLKGLKGDPGLKGSSGSPGPKGSTGGTGDMGERGDIGDVGDPGPKGLPGPEGIGNFSWCQWQSTSDASPGDQAKAQDSANVKIVAAYCTTDSAQEYNLQVTPTPNGYEYRCKCLGATLGTPNCILTYWECPIQAP